MQTRRRRWLHEHDFFIRICADCTLHKRRGIRQGQHLWGEDSKKRHEEHRKDCWTDSDPQPANSCSHQTPLTHYCLQQHEWNEHNACLRVNEEWRVTLGLIPLNWARAYITETFLRCFLCQRAHITAWAKKKNQKTLRAGVTFVLVKAWSLSIST